MSLYAVLAAYKQNRIIENAERALHFSAEVNVSGSIEKNKLALFDGEFRLPGKNRNASVPFSDIKIHEGILMVNPTELPYHARLVQKCFRERRFARINMRQYSQSDFFLFIYHNVLSFLIA